MDKWNSVATAAVLMAGVGFLASGLSGCSISPPSAAADAEEVFIRVIHASPGSPPLNLLVGDDWLTTSSTLYFGMATSYQKIASGQYDLGFSSRLRGSRKAPLSETDLDASVYADLSNLRYATVLAMGEPARMKAVVLPENELPSFDQAKVRFVNAVPDAPLVQWTTQEEALVPALPYGQVSDYVELKPGFSTLELREVNFPDTEIPAESEALIMDPSQWGRSLKQYDVEFRVGKVYTVYMVGLLRGEPELEMMVIEQDTQHLL